MSSRAFRRISQKLEQVPSEDVDDIIPNGNSRSYFPMLDISSDVCTVEEEADDVNVFRRKTRKKKKTKRKTTSSKPSELVDKCKTLESCDMNESSGNISDLLIVHSKSLDPSLELTRLFKSSIPESSIRKRGPKRGLLVHIKASWPPIVKFGLDMVRCSDGSFVITHSKDYEKAQAAFYDSLESMTPENVMQVLADFPYHIDSLLLLSDMLIQQDNSELGIDLLERVLHAYQSMFHPWFNPTTGLCYLDYKHQTNRGLFIAIFRYASLLGSRGCYRCALDYYKILFSLDVAGDPLAVLLIIDYFALLSKQWDFLIQLYDRLNPSKNLHLLPNFSFSVALATHWRGNSTPEPENADMMLQDALLMFPGFLTRLMEHATIGGVSNLDRSVLFGAEVQKEPPSLGRLLDLYVARTHQLWTTPMVLSWLESNVTTVLQVAEPISADLTARDSRLAAYSERRNTLYPDLPRNVLRHLVLSDIPEAPPLFPPGHSPRTIYCFDPLPPENSVDILKPKTQRHHIDSHDGIISSFLLSLLPGYSVHDNTVQGNEHPGSSGSTVGQAVAAAADLLASRIRHILDLRSPRDSRMQSGDEDNEEP